jgi:hypothetical protein
LLQPEKMDKNGKKDRIKKIRPDCKECHNQWKRNYLGTEIGFMKKLYLSIRERNVPRERTYVHSLDFSLPFSRSSESFKNVLSNVVMALL